VVRPAADDDLDGFQPVWVRICSAASVKEVWGLSAVGKA
jgi:hypothetical protein